MMTKMVTQLVCPYCGEQDRSDEIDYRENGVNEKKCEKCGKTFEYGVYVFYSSWKKGEKVR